MKGETNAQLKEAEEQSAEQDKEALKLKNGAEEKEKCKPFVKWAGGKTQLLPELIKRLPQKYFAYFEPMAGGGALFFRLQPKHSYLGETNPDLVNAYQVIKADVHSLIEDLEKHIYDEEYYYKIRNIDRSEEYENWTNIQKASRFIYLNKTCYNGLYRVNLKGHFNTPFGKYSNPTIVDQKNLLACSKALQNTFIEFSSFENIVEEARSGDFVYFDPPYAPLSKTSSFTGYVKGGFDASCQEKLRDTCVELKKKDVYVMISNSSTELVKDLYSTFKIEPIHAMRAINSKGEKRGRIEELIITSY